MKSATPIEYEAETAVGLESIAQTEITRLREVRVQHVSSGAIQFTHSGTLAALLHLKTVIAVYQRLPFAVPRPKALLGHAHFKRLIEAIQQIRAHQPQNAFRTLYISAAGAESSVMQRLKAELAAATHLQVGQDEGDFWLRLRRQGDGWEALLRLTPRPLATRVWRVRDLPGALNASVAHAMILLTQPKPDDVFVNLLSGSGTFLIERALHSPAAQIIGIDHAATVLALAHENLAASGQAARIQPVQSEARRLPLPAASVTALCADLPFGQLVGSHAENQILYPHLLAEAGRIAQIGAVFALITHEIRLIEPLLAQSPLWEVRQTYKITLGGLHPRIFVLVRR
jgi:23S rRNA G2445 N2-methylase RlmL